MCGSRVLALPAIEESKRVEIFSERPRQQTVTSRQQDDRPQAAMGLQQIASDRLHQAAGRHMVENRLNIHTDAEGVNFSSGPAALFLRSLSQHSSELIAAASPIAATSPIAGVDNSIDRSPVSPVSLSGLNLATPLRAKHSAATVLEPQSPLPGAVDADSQSLLQNQVEPRTFLLRDFEVLFIV